MEPQLSSEGLSYRISLSLSFSRLSLFCALSVSWALLLDASSHLYKRVCPSVRRSVGQSVRPSVRDAFVKIQDNL